MTSPEAHHVTIEGNPRRVRAFLAGEVVADSHRTLYLFETGHLPVYYFPRADVRRELLVVSDLTTHCPFKGQASYWSIRVGDRIVEDAVWGYLEPLAGCPDISGHVALYWDRLDAWFEEDQEVFVHPRDPHHRVDAVPSSRHVVVRREGVTLAESRRPVLVFETHLPTRYYLPAADVRMDLLSPTATRTRCPYKGEAVYWRLKAAGHGAADVAWSHQAPIPEIPKIESLVCFYSERVETEVDGITLDTLDI